MASQEKTTPVLLILSVLIPIVGYVLYFAKKDDNPEVAKNYLWGAIGGSIVGFVFMM